MNTADALVTDGVAATAKVTPLKEVWISVRTDGILFNPLDPVIIGDGSRENPWDGSTALKLDYILRQMLLGRTNTMIRLGPGVFRTGGGRGYTFYDKWTPLAGWRIVGSGQFQTTLLLTPYGETVASGVSSYWIVHSGTTYLDGFEIRDLTLDCGVDDHPMPLGARNGWPQTSGAGVWLGGRNNVIKRVRFVNFGTRAPGNVGETAAGPIECFPAILLPHQPLTADTFEMAYGTRLEECTFEQPYHSPGRECTAVIAGGGLPATTGKDFAMRRNYLSMELVNRLPYPPTKVRRIVYHSGEVTINGVKYPAGHVQTVETVGFHNVKADSLYGNVAKTFFVDIYGADDVSPGVPSPYNGRFRVLSPQTNDGSSRTLQILMPANPGGAPTGKMTLQDSPSPTLDILSITRTGATATVHFASGVKHKREVGDWVAITGATDGLYNGTFEVKAVSGNTFTYNMVAVPVADAQGTLCLDRRPTHAVFLVANFERLWGNSWIFETFSPHFRKPGEWILVGGILSYARQADLPHGSDKNPFNSYLKVDKVISPTKTRVTIDNAYDLADYFDLFEEELSEVSYDWGTGNSTLQTHLYAATILHFQAYSVYQAPCAAVERNRVFCVGHGGDYHDTWDVIDHVGRKNYHYDVFHGVFHKLQGDQNGYWTNLQQSSPSLAFLKKFYRGMIVPNSKVAIPGDGRL